MALPADLDQEPLAVANRPHRPGGDARVDEHAVGSFRLVERSGHGVTAVRVRLRKEEAAVLERKVRGNDDVLGTHDAAIGFDDAGLAVFDVCGDRLLEDVAPLAGNRRRQREQIFPRMELRLVLEPDRRRDPVRKRCLVNERDRKARSLLCFDLGLERRNFLVRPGIDVVGLALEVAVDAVFLDELGDPFEGGLVRSA